MSTQLEQARPISVQTKQPMIVCVLGGGAYTTCTQSYCINVLHGTVQADAEPAALSLDALVPYALPSGTEVVGTIDALYADRGRLVGGFDSRETTPADSESSERFVCRLPSGIGIVSTYDQCQRDGGTVVGKIGNLKDQI